MGNLAMRSARESDTAGVGVTHNRCADDDDDEMDNEDEDNDDNDEGMDDVWA